MMPRCDIFCHIIDNYGDIGVCWRLARQLAGEFGVAVTLWVNDLTTFARLAPALDPALPRQTLGAVTVCHWQGEIEVPDPGDIVIEGFGCTLPPGFLRAMQTRAIAPLWINLEYLSAEGWVEDCHGLASVRPATGLTQYFWFPGFTPRTGGLLREAGLLEARDRFQLDTRQHADFWTHIGVPEALNIPQRISLFSYENPAIHGLLRALSEGRDPALLLVPEGRALRDVGHWSGIANLRAGDRIHRGALTIAVLPLLSPEDYDRLLWACTCNVVRGEDSFVRAQWAGHPLLWHIYPQEEDAHRVKLEAFIHRVEEQTPMPALWAEALRAWNQGKTDPAFWAAFVSDLPAQAPAARAWSAHLATAQDLATQLMHFYGRQVE